MYRVVSEIVRNERDIPTLNNLDFSGSVATLPVEGCLRHGCRFRAVRGS